MSGTDVQSTIGTDVQARGEKLPSEVFSSMMRCVCGVQFDSWKPVESYDHRAHIYAAEQGIHW
jgi:hypothetical protein